LFREWNAFWEIYRMCKSERPDELHLNSSKARLLGALARRASRVPSIIFTVHCWPFHEKRNILWRVLIWLFSYLTTLLSNTVICISAFDRTHAYMPFVKKKIILIPNGIASATHKDRQQARSEL